jgi:alpha-tubulin suppressor-like RCC1 family protein
LKDSSLKGIVNTNPDFFFKNVVGFAYGSGPHVLAFTQSGDLYSWGHNGYSQLGNGNSQHSSVPILVQGALLGKVVTEAACGSHHSLVLTNDGELFAWGQVHQIKFLKYQSNCHLYIFKTSGSH